MTHAIYLGTDYNAVDTATPASPEYQGTVCPNSFTPTALTSGTTYYWRVDEIAYSSSNHGSVWSFSTTQPVLVAHLRFDETSGTTASDATGNGWNGTLVNGPLWRAGKYNNAVDLDGTDDYVSLPTGVVDGLTDFTISAWVYLDAVSTWSRVFDFGNNTTVNMFLTPRHSNSSGTVRFAITTSGAGGEQRINGSAALPTGVWTHVAVTHSGNTGILYVNGAEVGRNSSMSLTPDSLGATTKNYIGKSQYADPYLNGRVDDFRIYSKALSAADVAELANGITTCPEVQSLGYRLDADLNGDCQIDLSDLILLVNQWLSTSPEAVAPNYSPDIVVDDHINLADFAAMAEQWLVCNDPEIAGCIVNW
jgi:hypothetical protein